jgi:myosin heavy subunit
MEHEFQQHLEQQLEQQQQEQKRQQQQASTNNSDGGEWKVRFEDLERKHNHLKSELAAQQKVTEQVRQEAEAFLREMRELSDKTGSSWEREENMVREVQRLEDEVKHWKNRYEKSKTQLRHLRSSSIGLPGQIQDASAQIREHELTQADGLVKDIHITKFQMAIDEFLRTARSGVPSLVLDQMKGVVVAVRHITQDIESAQANGRADSHQLPGRTKTRVSATANNLITASKNFANSNGMSPVSLLDAAASHLSAAVIELVRMVKIRPTSEEELAMADDDDYLASMQSPGYFSVAPSQSRLSTNESVYSAISSPPSLRTMSQTHPRLAAARNTLLNGQSLGAAMKNGYAVREGDKGLEELRVRDIYLFGLDYID